MLNFFENTYIIEIQRYEGVITCQRTVRLRIETDLFNWGSRLQPFVSFAVCRKTNWPKELVAVARISALLKPPILFVHSHSKYSLISQTHWVLSRMNCYVMPLHYPSHIKRTIRVDPITACSEAHNLSNKQKAAAPMCDCFLL